MAASLTANAILAMNSGEVDLHPNVQVLDVRQIGTGQSVQERYRLVLSDGTYIQQAMLATQLNDLVKSGEVQKGSIVKLIEYICNTVQQRKIIIVLNMDVVVSVSDIIGDPKHVIMTDQQKQPAPPPQQQPQPCTNAGIGVGGGFKPGAGPSPVNSVYGKENVLSLNTAPTSKPTGYHVQQGFGSSSGSGTLTNGLPTTYGRPLGAPAYQQPSPMCQNRGPIVKNEAPARIVPIAALNPYQGRWTIKARVTAKGELRRYSNAKGEGKVFHFDLLDADGGEIRVTCFNSVADQFYDRIELGKVYLVSKGSLKPAQRTFNHLKNEWEIFLESLSSVERCPEEDASIPQQQFEFRSISEIENMEANAMVDLIGVVVAVSPTTTIMRKNGTETQKRSIHLRDTSGCSVELTMWGAFCNNEGQQLQELSESSHFPILAVKAARVSDFNGISVGTISSSRVLVNPNFPQAFEVKEWFEQVGKNTVSQSISKEGGSSGTRIEMRKTVSQIKDEGLGRSEKPDWISLKATISFIKSDSFCYTACPLPIGDRQCNKKVINNGDGTWRCDRCEKAIAECDYRYILSVQVQDHTGITWVTAFQEAGEELIGVSAKELYAWKQEENSKYADYIQRLLFSQYLFKLKVKEENYNDEQRVKCTVIKSEKIDHVAESKGLIDMIGRISGGQELGSTVLKGASTNVANVIDTGYNSYEGSTIPANVPMEPHGSGSYGGSTYQGSLFGMGASNSYNANISCFKCGGAHFSRDCPGERSHTHNAMGGMNTGGSIGNSNSCHKCGQAGHWARDCPSQGAGGYGRSSVSFSRGY